MTFGKKQLQDNNNYEWFKKGLIFNQRYDIDPAKYKNYM